MGFLDKLFKRKPKPYVDKRGIYLHYKCPREHGIKIRIDRMNDLNRVAGGFTWQKTIVCPRCFTQSETNVRFDGQYAPVEKEATRGMYISKEAFDVLMAPKPEPEPEIEPEVGTDETD